MHKEHRSNTLRTLALIAVLGATSVPAVPGQVASAQTTAPTTKLKLPSHIKGQPIGALLSAGGEAAVFGPDQEPSPDNPVSGAHDNGRGGNTFVNDPCLDPPPPNRRRTVQSETEIAVLNTAGSMGKKMVAGYNDSWGFYDRNQGLSGYAYSVDGGNVWIDGGGLPPAVPGPGTPFDEGKDGYFGDPVVVVHHATQTFYFSSIYKAPDGHFTISVNRGVFAATQPEGALPPAAPESRSDTRCLNNPDLVGVAQPGKTKEKLFWFPPVQTVQPSTTQFNDFLDKEWLYVDQTTGTLYVTYTRFTTDGQTPIELARCLGCAFKPVITSADWDGPYVIVENELTEFNQATMPVTTVTANRVIVTWYARRFPLLVSETEQAIEYAVSNDNGMTWSGERLVKTVNPQGEPPGYNRRRNQILNAPYINVDKGSDDGVFTSNEQGRPGFGNVYITYFDGKDPLPQRTSAADIYVSTSDNDGETFDKHVKVNDDPGTTSHVFPTVQVNKNGYIYVDWLDRRRDPVANALTDTWANVSKNLGLTFGPDRVQTDYATNWFVRADARPNFGDYNSSDLLAFNDFVIIWADGRFYPPGGQSATPDTIFSIANGLGVGQLSK